MPRARKVVTEVIDPQALHDHAIRQAVELYGPYAVVAAAELELQSDDYCVVYRAPKGGKRVVVATRSVRSNAVKLRKLLEVAWAEGYWSSGRG